MIDLRAVLVVQKAAEAACIKHGKLTDDRVRACAILARECAEAMDEALKATAPVKDVEFDHYAADQRLYEELAQVAATAMLFMTKMHDAYKGRDVGARPVTGVEARNG